MEIEVIKKEKNLVEFVLYGERHTLPNLLKSRLLQNPKVEFTAYKQKHPEENKIYFIVKTKKDEDVKKVVLQTCKDLMQELTELDKKISAALK